MYRCDLIAAHRRQKNNSITIERSQVTKRTTKFSYPNIQKRTFEINETINGKSFKKSVTVRINNHTNRTIEKYGGLLEFLTKYKRHRMTLLAKNMRRQLENKLNKDMDKSLKPVKKLIKN